MAETQEISIPGNSDLTAIDPLDQLKYFLFLLVSLEAAEHFFSKEGVYFC